MGSALPATRYPIDFSRERGRQIRRGSTALGALHRRDRLLANRSLIDPFGLRFRWRVLADAALAAKSASSRPNLGCSALRLIARLACGKPTV